MKKRINKRRTQRSIFFCTKESHENKTTQGNDKTARQALFKIKLVMQNEKENVIKVFANPAYNRGWWKNFHNVFQVEITFLSLHLLLIVSLGFL